MPRYRLTFDDCHAYSPIAPGDEGPNWCQRNKGHSGPHQGREHDGPGYLREWPACKHCNGKGFNWSTCWNCVGASAGDGPCSECGGIARCEECRGTGNGVDINGRPW